MLLFRELQHGTFLLPGLGLGGRIQRLEVLMTRLGEPLFVVFVFLPTELFGISGVKCSFGLFELLKFCCFRLVWVIADGIVGEY